MVKKIPDRMCIACRQMKEKRELIRIVKNKEGQISLDFTGKKPGRGAYVCKDMECLEKCRKNKLLNRTFSCNIDNEIYEKLKEEFLGESR